MQPGQGRPGEMKSLWESGVIPAETPHMGQIHPLKHHIFIEK